MGHSQSKEELLYQQVNYGNIEGIKELRRQGAGLEWVDKECRTPLIVACMDIKLLNVAETLLEFGAKANSYRPGRYAGTPLHHAAKRGLEGTVKLLLSHGANPLIINDDCQTPLDLAREKGFTSVVRTIEGHVCLFSGWLREFYGAGILNTLAPNFFARQVWAAVLPCGSRNPTRPYKLELAIYHDFKDACPRMVFQLWKAHLEEPNFQLEDALVTIHNISTKVRVKLGPLDGTGKLELERFCNACKGITQASPAFLREATAPPVAEESAGAVPFEPVPPMFHECDRVGDDDDSHVNCDGPITYPEVDVSPVDDSVPTTSGASSAPGSCVICLDAPVEAACVPCGHMAGCMSCLSEVKAKNWECPVCRSPIQQVVRLYTV